MAANGPRTVAAILVAGGSGSRLGADVPKAFCEIGGSTLLERAASRFVTHPAVGQVVVVVPRSHVEEAKDLLDDASAQDVRLDAALAQMAVALKARGVAVPPGLDDPRASKSHVVAGGATRQLSVLAGLQALDPGVDFVLVHDVARPFVRRSLVKRVLDGLATGADAVVPVLPVHDTIRRIDAAGGFAGVVDRSELVAVQTPQGFRRAALEQAHAAGAALAVTDDAALVEALGGVVLPVDGDEAAFKITRPWDLVIAEALAESPEFDG